MNPTRGVFVLEAACVAEAHVQLSKMPLVSAGPMHFELIELKPFTNWSLLFHG